MNLLFLLWVLYEGLVSASNNVPTTGFKRNATIDYVSMNLTCYVLDEFLPIHPRHPDRGSRTACSILCRNDLAECFAFGIDGRVCVGCLPPLMSTGPVAPLPADGLYEQGILHQHHIFLLIIIPAPPPLPPTPPHHHHQQQQHHHHSLFDLLFCFV